MSRKAKCDCCVNGQIEIPLVLVQHRTAWLDHCKHGLKIYSKATGKKDRVHYNLFFSEKLHIFHCDGTPCSTSSDRVPSNGPWNLKYIYCSNACSEISCSGLLKGIGKKKQYIYVQSNHWDMKRQTGAQHPILSFQR